MTCKHASNQKKDIKLPITNSRCKTTRKHKNKTKIIMNNYKKNYQKKNKEIEQKVYKKKEVKNILGLHRHA